MSGLAIVSGQNLEEARLKLAEKSNIGGESQPIITIDLGDTNIDICEFTIGGD